MKRAEVESLTENAVKRKTRAETNGHEEAPDGPSERTVYARCRTCGHAGWHEVLSEPTATNLQPRWLQTPSDGRGNCQNEPAPQIRILQQTQ
jgi:hypothetical protein